MHDLSSRWIVYQEYHVNNDSPCLAASVVAICNVFLGWPINPGRTRIVVEIPSVYKPVIITFSIRISLNSTQHTAPFSSQPAEQQLKSSLIKDSLKP